ncbi:disease resistance protein PIK6-NP-like [Oryza brachyantha]|uniref:disease resistance protein PIK6-NP-like n=1 Tax=Oryza brachyantha TaxID=4533 RepID=UPI001ADD3E70|nr:disease resistance protein PIK6-NP-like [Oryza brachyantha]
MADLALSTVHALLGVIRKEAELLAGVRGDVQFIRDEMESINGLLRHLAGTKERASDHQVRAWIKQVMELAYDSNNCVERYARTRSGGPRRRKGFVGRLRRLARLPKAMWVRRRVATRIRQLKVRVREVGERQQRYGVAVPPKTDGASAGAAAADRSRPREYSSLPRKIAGGDASRRQRGAAIIAECGKEHMLKERADELIRWLDIGVAQDLERPKLSLVVVVAPDAADGSTLATKIQSEGCVAESMGDDVHTWSLDTLKEKVKNSMRGKRSLVFITNVDYLKLWFDIGDLLASIDCDKGSAVVLSSRDRDVINKLELELEQRKKQEQRNKQLPLMKTISYSYVEFHHNKAKQLLPSDYSSSGDGVVRQILGRCDMDDSLARVFLHALHNNPNRTEGELKTLLDNLSPERCSNDPMEKRVRLAAFCYYGLPDRYKNCLWYTAAFVRGSFDIRRASLTRRWIAEGLIVRSGQPTEHEEAESCVDALLSLNLLMPRQRERGVVEGKVKTCSVNTPVIDIISGGRSTVDDFLDTNEMPLDPDLHFSVRNGIRIRQLDVADASAAEPRPPPPKKQLESVMEFLRKLPASLRLRLLRVLDLDGCGVAVTKHHLNNICKIRKLRYLSLRGTNVAQLPKLLHRLELLETLDIRQTRVRVFDAALPRSLKHLLAGRIDCPSEQDAATVKAKQTFSTVSMPAGVPAGYLDKLEILSHVQVSDSREELAKLGENLKRLRKLGVVLCGGEKANLSDLFTQINHLHGTLRSLSIRMKPIACWGSNEVVLSTPPLLLESLRISGVRGWLPHRIKELKNLAKLTLRDTLLDAESLAVVGVLKGLRCLRLLYHSFHGGELAFGDDTFLSLAGLVVEDDMVTTIAFTPKAAPKLAKIIWSFTRMESMKGVKNLGSLRRVELNRLARNGDATNKYPQLKQELDEHPNKPKFVPRLIGPKEGDQV